MTIRALSPLDGRYAGKVGALRDIFSEHGLIRYRVLVEVRWLQWLADEPSFAPLPPLPPIVKGALNRIVDGFTTEDTEKIKKVEATTNHDVKAVEYFIRGQLGTGADVGNIGNFIHFGCTSEDVNNLAYALMLRFGRDNALVPAMKELRAKLRAMANEYAALPMLSRTHGQPATPTTLGKELANFASRLARAQAQWSKVEIRGKMNGAVGNFNAHVVACPEVDWADVSQRFVESLGLSPNPLTTQIEPHDWTAEYADALARYATVLLDLCRDLWGYVSLGYFRLRVNAAETGSSTMPHKVNPIDFENAEGNLGIARALLGHFAEKLPVSRWQRDLSDSTVQRNFGVAAGHVLLALRATLAGLEKVQADTAATARDLDDAWEVLAEAVQTVMRCHGIAEPYEQLKALTRGRKVTRDLLHEFIAGLDIPKDAKQRLLDLTPATYIGLAPTLARS
ncbi:MAG TPA: adenylosuccinate lyase [Woeseiaceae bacterium]